MQKGIIARLSLLHRRTSRTYMALLFAMMVASTAHAQTSIVPTGDGTAGNPYQIGELGHLVWMGNNVGSSSGKYYVVQNDIDATATAGWSTGYGPVVGSFFMGIFDGNGKIIHNLTMGLFASVGNIGVVKNLGLEGGTVTRSSYSLAMDNYGTVSGCHATCNVTGPGMYAGGLVGDNEGTMRGCYATGSVTMNAIAAGGLLGANSSAATVSGCYASGTVTGSDCVGGLVGWNQGPISGCSASGIVAGRTYIGGLVGRNDNRVMQCYARGSVSGSSYVGGLVGLNFGNNSMASECYATGAVTGNNGGGLVGHNSGTVGTSYWDTQNSGQSTSAGGTGKTTAQMKQQTTFAGWDFTYVWHISENVSYPVLRDLCFTWDFGCQDLGEGWYWLSWFGYFAESGNGWIYHLQHSWMYCVGTNQSSLWLYDLSLGWLWTGSTTYPYLYSSNDGAWLWYEVGSTNPRWFCNLKTSKWESH